MRMEALIDGMLAVHARHAVFMALTAVEGIMHAEVELGRAELTHDGRATEPAIRAAIEAAGFTVRAVRPLPRRLPTI
jgi:copper chaperone CopZ